MKNGPFVVISGMPRSGTRQFADYLNATKEFAIQGEVHPSIYAGIKSILISSESVYSRHQDVFASFRAKKKQTIFNLFSGFSKSEAVLDVGGLVGFKCPNAELHHHDIKDIALDSYGSIHYFYCIRNARACLSSLRSAPWYGGSANYFLNTYSQSLEAAIKINEERRCRVSVLHLDDFIASDIKGEWIRKYLLSPASCSPNDEELTDIISVENRNSTKNRFGKVRKGNELTANDEDILFSRSSEINSIISKFNDVFGMRLELL